MRSSILSLILILTFSSSIGHSQTPPPTPPLPVPILIPSIKGPSTFAEGTLANYSVPGYSNVAYKTYPPVSGSSFLTSDGVFIFTASPGSYYIEAAGADKDNKIFFLDLAVTVTSSADPIGPLAIAIFDPATLTSLPAGQVGIYESQTIASSLYTNGVIWLSYGSLDVIPTKTGSSPLSKTTWGSQALQIGLPALVTSINGAVTAVPLPQTEAAIITYYANLNLKRKN